MLDKETEKRINGIISELTLEEKISMCHGSDLFRTAGIKRLGIPPLVMSDGPCGVRGDNYPGTWEPSALSYNKSSYLPVNTAIAATWNSKRAFESGCVLGEEARGRGKDIILSPGVNIMRSPLCGRNYEYMSEDPYLAANIAVPVIKGIQSEDTAACVKHFALNSQETNRLSVNARVSDRALMEIYLPAFKAAVKEGGVFAVMGAYNKLRGTFCSHSAYLLKKILKDEWGFDGVAISDWGAVHNAREAANGGLDIEMDVKTKSEDYYFAKDLADDVKSGQVQETEIDDKVRRILRLMFKLGMIDGYKDKKRKPGTFNSPAHCEQSLKTAEESVTLLKNDRGILPFDPERIKNLLVVGPGADRCNAPAVRGGDSADINALFEITPLTGIMMRLGGNTHVEYEKGCGETPDENKELFKRAVEKAKNAQAVIFAGGFNRGLDCEGSDRETMKMPLYQDELINRLTAANPNTAVVIISGSPVCMESFADGAHAIVQSYYAGMESGYALAKVLFGDVCPSGKLPFTIPKNDGDIFAGISQGENLDYNEDVFVGYRYFDTNKIEPEFCFGHGLSYTSFEYSGIKCRSTDSDNDVSVKVSATIKNTGERKGAETVQLYVAPPQNLVKRPEQELKGFAKVFLAPGEAKKVEFTLRREAFAYFDGTDGKWVCEKGGYEIRLSASSRDIRLRCDTELTQTLKYI